MTAIDAHDSMRPLEQTSSSALNSPVALANAAAQSQGRVSAPAFRSNYHQELARWYAEHGVRIFPCNTDKCPLIRNWNRQASSDPEQVQRWWARFPHAIIGIPCESNGFFIVDIDCHDGGAKGLSNFFKVMPRQAPLPSGMITVGTPNDGLHLWFGMRSTLLKNSAGKLTPGVDTRGVGGFVIAPGCVLPDGRSWKIKSPITLAEFVEQLEFGGLPSPPAWIIQALLVPAKAPLGEHITSLPAEDRFEALDRECAKVRQAAQGTRNDTLNRAAFAAGQVVAAGVARELAEDRLTEAALAVGLEHDEIQATLASGLSAGLRSPRKVTPQGNEPAWPDVCKDGRPKPTYPNAKFALQALGITFEHDTFHRRKTIGGHPIGRFAGEITDDAIAAVRDLIVRTFGFDPQKEHAYDAANALCIENPVDPVCDWLDALSWDGQLRLDNWLIDYAGAAATPLNRAAGVLLLVAMVRRARQPGCKFDIMFVFEGSQGVGKSTLLLALAGGADNFTDAPLLGRDVKTVAETLSGKLVAEIPELAGLRRSDVEDVKALISRTDDRARPAYGRYVESHPRRCVFVGTTNAEVYLADDTGNRRFVPVTVGAIDLAAFVRDRDQLFAEAVNREKAYRDLTLPSSVWSSAAAQTDARRVVDPWVETLRAGFDPGAQASRPAIETLPNNEKRILTGEVERMLGLQPQHCNTSTHRRLTTAMKEIGWKPQRWRTGGGGKVRGFVK